MGSSPDQTCVCSSAMAYQGDPRDGRRCAALPRSRTESVAGIVPALIADGEVQCYHHSVSTKLQSANPWVVPTKETVVCKSAANGEDISPRQCASMGGDDTSQCHAGRSANLEDDTLVCRKTSTAQQVCIVQGQVWPKRCFHTARRTVRCERRDDVHATYVSHRNKKRAHLQPEKMLIATSTNDLANTSSVLAITQQHDRRVH